MIEHDGVTGFVRVSSIGQELLRVYYSIGIFIYSSPNIYQILVANIRKLGAQIVTVDSTGQFACARRILRQFYSLVGQRKIEDDDEG